MLELIIRLLRRIQPREGWLLWLLALATVLLVPVAAGEAAWVPNLGSLLALVAAAAFLAGFALARLARSPVEDRRRWRLPVWLAALLAAVAGLLAVTLFVGWSQTPQLPASVPGLVRPVARAMLAETEMAERLAQWLADVRAGVAGQDDAVFRWILGLAVWAAVVWAAWELFRKGNALAAFLPVGLLLVTNAYFFWRGRLWVPFFFGCVTLIMVLAERQMAEQRWQREGKDFSRDLRLEMFLIGGGLALLVTLASIGMVRVVVQPTAQWFEELAAAPLDKLKAGGEALFPGLRRAPRSLIASGGGSGGMPRAFLLDSGPELGEELVMRVATDELQALPAGRQPDSSMQHYWRALTYDSYTGRGWRNTPVQVDEHHAGQPWLEEIPTGRRLLRQQIELQRGGDQAYYAAGEPLSVNRPYETLVRSGADDPGQELVAVTGNGRRYQVLSAVPGQDEAALRGAGGDYPAAIARRYLELPDVPRRVAALAREVAAGATTPYDRALALQSYLRQFPYNLNVEPAPPDRDVADYFLFDLQSGYCDYYATAMVVMARSIGIPARLAVGYATGDYDPAEGAYLVYEDMAHSWPELYFPGAGWVPFEPTASQQAIDWQIAGGSTQYPYEQLATQAAADLQTFREDEIVRQRAGGLVALLALLAVAGIAFVLWRRRPAPPLPGIYQALGRWGRRLGRRPGEGETPDEFGRALYQQLRPSDAAGADQVLTFMDLYQQATYGPQPAAVEPVVRSRWEGLRARLRRAWLRRKLGRSTG